jgi:hypothetical protein
MADSNNGVVNNEGTIEIPAGGKMTNGGIVNNSGAITIAGTGTIVNNGKIDNAKGTINNNKGGTFESVQDKEDMGGVVNGDVVLLGNNNNGNNNGGSGGCDAGFGAFGLLLAGLAALKYRRA